MHDLDTCMIVFSGDDSYYELHRNLICHGYDLPQQTTSGGTLHDCIVECTRQG